MAADLVAVGGLSLAIALAVLFRLGPDTLLLGGLILLVLGWSAWKRHHFGELALLIDRGDRSSFLRSSVAAKEAELKRSAVGLALILPATFLTMLLLFAIRDNGEGGDVVAFLASLFVTPKGMVTGLLLVVAVVILATAHRRVRRELEQLEALQAEYAEEEWRDRIIAA